MEHSTFSKIISSVLYCLLFGGLLLGGYVYKKEVSFVVKANVWRIKPCSFTTTYSIGTFDTRFGISKEEFLSDLEQASMIWDEPLNTRHFTYKEEGGDITINLIYDKRQETTNELEVVNSTISAGKREYEVLKSEYSPLVAKYETAKTLLATRIREYKTRTESYNQTVLYWNNQGGAPKAEYEQLAQEKINLDKEANLLKQAQDSLNAQVPKLNQMVTEMNDVIAKHNLNIKTYNTVGAAIGKEFDEGQYEQTFGKRSISIYQFDNDNKLIRVLAHEFGHALGLDHVEDEDAIMYYLNESTNDKLTDADINELKKACKVN